MLEESDQHAAEIAAITAAGAYVMGRNMFGPVRGDWDLDWRGWWGEDPPYHAPVFVLTHHPREPLEMEGGTTFTSSPTGSSRRSRRHAQAADERDVAIAGGAATVNQYLAAGLVDELRLHVAPLVIGAGERLLEGVGNLKLEPTGRPTGSGLVTHLGYRVVR